MQTSIISNKSLPATAFIPAVATGVKQKDFSLQPGSIKKELIWYLFKMRIFILACFVFKQPNKIRKAFDAIIKLRNNVWGGDLKKIHKVNGKYYFNQYMPGWPSKAYDKLVINEMKRHASPHTFKEKLSFVILAITRKCPLRCEHCFEWDNLNQKESFTKEDLYKVVDLYQQQGIWQFHFSGGEPMVRFKELLPLIKYASKKSECWVLTSGFNFNTENAVLLKQAGCIGAVVSLDHYIPELHNLFRGSQQSYNMAINAVSAARQAGMVTSISVCATKEFIVGGHLMPYMAFANELGVQFVQVLEPRRVGHYDGKNVMLDEKHIASLEETFTLVNHDAAYKNYPTMLYHGYHQRRVGCFMGNRSVYVDSAGDVHACPFCHTKSYNIIDHVRTNEKDLPVKENKCPMFEKIE